MEHRYLVLLVTILLLLTFFSYGIRQFTGNVVTQEATVESAVCHWGANAFDVCATVSKQFKDTTAKVFITGGTPLSQATVHSASSFTHCESIPAIGDSRDVAVNVYVYDRGRLVSKNMHTVVHCEKTSTPSDFQDTFDIFAQRTESHEIGQGVVILPLPSSTTLSSCTFEGTFETKNAYDSASGGKDQKKFCNGLKGTFTGFIDNQGSFGMSDPSSGKWAYSARSSFDPPPVSYKGKIFEARTCDNSYLNDPENLVTIAVAHWPPRNNALELAWEYYDNEWHTQLQILGSVSCASEPVKKLPKPAAVQKPPTLTALEPVDSPFEEPVFEEPEPLPSFTQPLTPWQSFKQTLIETFL